MDLFKITLGTKLMRGLVAKYIAKAIKSKTGKEAIIDINDISLRNDEKTVTVHFNVDAEMKTEDFYILLETLAK